MYKSIKTYTRTRCQVSIYRTTGPLVVFVLMSELIFERCIWAPSWHNLSCHMLLLQQRFRSAYTSTQGCRKSLISALFAHCLDSIISVVALSKIPRSQLASVAEQASLSLIWPQSSKDRFSCDKQHMSRLMTKPTKWHVHPAKTQISLGIRPVWSKSSLSTQWIAKDLSFIHADSKDPDQTGRMPRLTRVFSGRTVTLLVLSRCGSYIHVNPSWWTWGRFGFYFREIEVCIRETVRRHF